MSTIRTIRRAIQRADLDTISKRNNAADIVEALLSMYTKWSTEVANQGAILQQLVTDLAGLIDKHNALVAALTARGHLSKDDGMTQTESGIIIPKGVA